MEKWFLADQDSLELFSDTFALFLPRYKYTSQDHQRVLGIHDKLNLILHSREAREARSVDIRQRSTVWGMG